MMSACLLVILVYLTPLTTDNVPEILPGRTNVGPKAIFSDTDSVIFDSDIPPNPNGFSPFNNGKILTSEVNLQSLKGYAETSIAQTRDGNLMFIGFNAAHGFCDSNPPDHPYCPGVPDGFYNGGSGYTVSFDGGKSWQYHYAPPFIGTNYYTRGDPWFSIGGKSSKHTREILYFSSLCTDSRSGGESLGVVVHTANIIYKNNDPSNEAIDFEWIRASLIPKVSPDDFMDKEAIAADPFDPYKAYVTLTLFNSGVKFVIQVYATHDAGLSWKGPVVLQDGWEQTRVWSQMTYPLVNADGDVYVIWQEYLSTEDSFLTTLSYMFVASTDGGETFSEKLPMNPTFTRYSPICQVPIAYNRFVKFSQPTMDVFTNKKNKHYLNRIIAVYEYAFEDACTGNLDGFIDDESFVLNSIDIGISYSDDKGATWNFIHPFRYHTPTRFVKRIWPSVSVSSDGQSVNIAYLQINETKRTDLPICESIAFRQRTSLYHTFVDTYYIHSNNGGTSWSDPIKLNDEPVDWCTTYTNVAPNFGDYMLGVTDSKGKLHLAGVTNGFTVVGNFEPPRTASDVIYYNSYHYESYEKVECYIKKRCKRTDDCCKGYNAEAENDITCSADVKRKKGKHEKFCCVKNMGRCRDDYECCGGETRCINHKCHSSAQWRGKYSALVDNEQKIEDILEDSNTHAHIEINVPLAIMFIAICAILLCIACPLYFWSHHFT